MTIKLQPQSQQDYNEWVRLGRKALTRKVHVQSIDDSAVVYTLLEVKNSLPEDATDEDFTARALHSFMWYWGRIKHDSRGVETRRVLKEVPFIKEYIKQKQTTEVDLDELYSFIRSRGYRVGKEAIKVAFSNSSTSLDGMFDIPAHKSDELKTIDEACVTDCLRLYRGLYGDTPGLYNVSKVFYTDVPFIKTDKQSLLKSVSHLLVFVRHQFSQDAFNNITSVLLNSNHQPTRSYQEVFHV